MARCAYDARTIGASACGCTSNNYGTIHNGTFDLSVHTWTAPFSNIVDIAENKKIQLMTPRMGQLVSVTKTLQQGAQVDKWWRQ